MSSAQRAYPRVILLAGPTASGKTALAIRLAQQHDGVIINADSMQVYADIPILCASPTPEERSQAPHRLYGYLDAAQPCSVGLWLEAVRIAIYETWQQGKTPIMVGGTGLYLRSFIEGISPIPEIPPAIRDAVRALPTSEAYAWLCEHDTPMAAKLNAGDSQRISRACEVMQHTGKSLLYWQSLPPQPIIPEAQPLLYRLQIERDLLYARCNQRLEMMLQQGALEELTTLLARKLPDSLPAMRAVGVPELTRHLRGEWTLPYATEKAQQATRNYAKRQLTWLRNQFPNAVQIAYPYENLPDI
ncbi:MAG: tRNA (adenosine(37)-N6)-dimethylallyltransferase MiaA [Alphaproteobacteria bacterium]|nr:tRNA (adenosine(37)-N6)-dimethylallyltransferase MiaA [Alphaproteobacteria bacterium]